MLKIDVRQRLGTFALDVRLSAGRGVLALFGRSGAGKTALMNIIGGLTRPDDGRVAVGATTLVDTRRQVFVPAHKRRLGYVFQEGRLFPHLTVRQNLLYGRWFAAGADAEAVAFESVVGLLGLEPCLERRPRYLSGGEKQRVAIGRALLANPRLLLMDEPLASLDEARKAEIMPYLERLAREARVPIVYVTHSVAEVARLADTVAVLAEGALVAIGPVSDIMQRLDLFSLLGRREAGAVIDATVAAHDDGGGISVVATRAGQWFLPRLAVPVGARIRFRVRARDVMLATEAPRHISALNVIAGTVSEIGPATGPVVDIRLDCGGQPLIARLTLRSVERLALAPGCSVYAIIKSVAVDRRGVGWVEDAGPETDHDALDL